MRQKQSTGTGSALASFFLLLGIVIMPIPLKNIDTHLKKAAPLEKFCSAVPTMSPT